MNEAWLYKFKRQIVIGMVLLLSLSMGLAMFVIIMTLRTNLLDSSAQNARLLGNAVTSSLRNQMLNRHPDLIQSTIMDIGKSNSVTKIFIFNKDGTVAFSSQQNEIGTQLKSLSDSSCRGCHQSGLTASAPSMTVELETNSGKVHRNVTVIFNEPACYGCHPATDRINGKLIIDRSLEQTYSTIRAIEAVILLSGAFCLLLIVPFLSRMIDRYIEQLILKNKEIGLVYSIIDNISKTIDMDELKNIVLDIVSDAFSADEVDIVLPKGEKSCRVVTRTKDGEKLLRKKISDDAGMSDVIERWLEGRCSEMEIVAGGTEIYLPIEKGDNRLALLIIRCRRSPFPSERLALIGAICNHIAIAFENARLYSIAITDELTGLFTVRHFRTCIDRQHHSFERYGEKYVLLMIDIDNFKKVNDTYGHVTGDEVLKDVANCIANSIRGFDQAFRYGGEEFAVLLPVTGVKGGVFVAERVRANIATAEFVVDGIHIPVTVSIGISICPDTAGKIKEMIIEADTALYAAKHKGKDCVVLSDRTQMLPDAAELIEPRPESDSHRTEA